MQSSTVEVLTAAGAADAYLARVDERPYPGVLFIMDAYGLRPTIERWSIGSPPMDTSF
jgi:carboxymethylenebutenolidase